MTTRKPWTDDEQRAVIALYFHMLDLSHRSPKTLNKAALIRNAQRKPIEAIDSTRTITHIDGPLSDRSRGSIEAKLMNITACVHDLGQYNNSMAEFGYRPLSNYQKSLKTAVAEYFAAGTLQRDDESDARELTRTAGKSC